MNKCIIAISGKTDSKNAFREIVETLGYKIKGADCDQELQEIVRRLGWNGKKDEKYYLFYNELFKIANFAFNFKRQYIARAIENFWNDNKSQILVVRGSDELEKELEEEFGIFNLFIAKNQLEVIENELKYDKIILIDNNFEKSVRQTLDILLKENVKI